MFGFSFMKPSFTSVKLNDGFKNLSQLSMSTSEVIS